ncbi:LCCL domain-containing protein, putative [Plasmodium ovale]|uniref:LCCL domain-containing protein (CCp3) n=2 Tax=Plasmodium ovale TaxID=36330 RepID=A0A1A8WXU1_PLAOA|nr:LCCL domain-containing protein (CCp3) [Plasmodium ovale curtisi]SBS97782.1 LCCL domain-containing protein (CCp3) [Plasmodium ovale curtisi]SCP06339.1 LCCL domain-containing protein, putative [Plasmodium ovale]
MPSYKDSIRLLLLPLLVLTAYGREWCKATFEYGKSDYAECLHEGDSITKYMIETIPIISSGIDLYSNVSIVLSNGYGIKTKEIIIGNEKEGLLNKILTVRKDIGYPEYVHVKLNSPYKKWKCKKIIIWKDYKYWVFDCIDLLNSKTQEATYFLSGHKFYTAYVQTGKDIEAGTIGSIEIILLGENKRSNTKILHEGFASGGLKKIKFQASDVGSLEDIILTNNSINDPWYCDFVKIKSDNKIYVFNVKSWIGHPYDSTVKVNIKTDHIDGNAKDIDCHIRGNDLVNTYNLPKLLQRKVQIFKVRCPQNCQNSEFSSIEGSSIHPSSTSICTSAIHDGSLSPSGGEIIVTVGNDIQKYHAIEGMYNELAATDFTSKADETIFSFYTYHLNSIDDIKSNIRLVDPFGKLSSLGRLEIRINNKWGTVCKKGPNFSFTDDSAKRACKDLGFVSGIYVKQNCANIDGQNYCAGYKYPFNSAGILCAGNEKHLLKCNGDDATHCIDHHDDVVIQCLSHAANELVQDGTIRLVDVTGAPSNNGIGRLQIYYNGIFGSVCSEGWMKETEKIACQELGFTGVKGNGFSHHSCANVFGENLCGYDTERINAVNFKCKGDEQYLKDCTHETHEDIYCSHEEDIVIACTGEGGDSSGGGAISGKKKNLMILEKKKFPQKIELTCIDKIVSKGDLSNANVGDVFLVSCPEKCDEEVGVVKGTFLYTFDSHICKAAIHAGVLANTVADDIVLIITHKHNRFMGTKRNNIESHEFNGISKAFSVSIPTTALLREEGKGNPKSDEEMLKREDDFSYSHIFDRKRKSLTSSTSAHPTFQWIAPPGFFGFNGKEKDFINCNNLPNEKYIKSLSNFSFVIYFTVNGGKGTWRTLISHSLCDGISISVDEENELIIEQNCNPHLIKTKFKPQFGKTYHLVVVFNKTAKMISLYINGKKVILEKSKYDFTLNGDLVIGRSNQSTTDYFVGSIHLVEVYKYLLSEDEIGESLHSVMSLDYVHMNNSEQYTKRKKQKNGKKKTVDGRECITPCKSKSIINKDLQVNTEEIYLKCEDDILSEQFNGKIGSQFLVICSDNCTKSKFIVKGSNNYYTPDTSICKAAIHAGVYLPNSKTNSHNGSFFVRIVEGLLEYQSARGHFGIVSKSEKQSQLRSFSVFKQNEEDNIFTCSTKGQSLLNLSIGEKKTIICPPNCEKTNDNIFGTNVYSPLSPVCKAAIHAGVLSNKGGRVDIIMGSSQQEFKGSVQNNIQSYPSAKHNYSFTPSRYSQHRI